MAYGQKYLFRFQPLNGGEIQISIEKDGYSGSVIQRCLGKAPVLKRERNGHVCGTSLEIYAECQVDGELAEFYTSDPHAFRVTLTDTNAGVLFMGYVSPELYSEPDIAPPYDVQIIATDGLGELRRYQYAAQGQLLLRAQLEYLLGFTGLATGFYHNNTSIGGATYSSYSIPSAAFFDEIAINLDNMAGKSCYDVLSALLDSLNADLFFRYASSSYIWQILREVDVESAATVVCNRDKTSTGDDITTSATTFGTMQNWNWWPIGQMESEVKPACKRLTVVSDAAYKNALLNPDMSAEGSWTMSDASYDSDLGAYKITAASGYISQSLSFTEAVRRKLSLTVRMRQYRPTASATSESAAAYIVVSKEDTYHSQGTRYLTQNTLDEYYWTSNYAQLPVVLPAPVYGDGEEACVETTVELPLYMNGSRDWSYATDLEVKIVRNHASIPLLVHSAYLTVAESDQIAGYKDIFNIDNGARDDADEVTTLFMPGATGYYATPGEFMYGCLLDYDTDWEPTDRFTDIGEDYAKCCCLPRLYKRGTLNVPANSVAPFIFRDSDGINYLLRSFEWDLYNSEMTVELLSLPAASVTISSQDVTELVYTGSTTSSSSSSSGGGGGGSAGVSSVGLSMPAAFTVSGSPVTSAGTIAVSLGESYDIPTTTQESQWSQAYTNMISADDRYLLALGAKPVIKILNKHNGSPQGEGPLVIIRHPLLRQGATFDVVLMVRHRKNKNRNSNSNKGWFEAFGAYPTTDVVIDTFPGCTQSEITIAQSAIKAIIAGNYCQSSLNTTLDPSRPWYPVYDGGTDCWLDYVSQNSSATIGLGGRPGLTQYRGSLMFGLALRMDNPAFDALVNGTLSDHTGSISGVKRYFYSEVAPMLVTLTTASTMYQAKGTLTLRAH